MPGRGPRPSESVCSWAQGPVEAGLAARVEGQASLLAKAHQQSIDLAPQLPVGVGAISVEGGWEGGEPALPHPNPAHLGSHSSSALRVSSGDLVAFLVHLSRFTILCTCVSTAAWRRGRVNTGQAHRARLPHPCHGSQCGLVGG